MITITTDLHRKFGMLPPDLQELLLSDVGFLNLDDVQQLKLVLEILDLTSEQLVVYRKNLIEYLSSDEYKTISQTYDQELQNRVHEADKIIARDIVEIENKEHQSADLLLNQL